jgi:hypothetical protein
MTQPILILDGSDWYLQWLDGERVGPYESSEAACADLRIIQIELEAANCGR